MATGVPTATKDLITTRVPIATKFYWQPKEFWLICNMGLFCLQTQISNWIYYTGLYDWLRSFAMVVQSPDGPIFLLTWDWVLCLRSNLVLKTFCMHYTLPTILFFRILYSVTLELLYKYVCRKSKSPWDLVKFIDCETDKGQLISEWNFGVFKSPKKSTKFLTDFFPSFNLLLTIIHKNGKILIIDHTLPKIFWGLLTLSTPFCFW